MEEKDEKGFVVKDRRKISLDDSVQEPEEKLTEGPAGSGEKSSAEQQRVKDEFKKVSEDDKAHSNVFLPEVSLSTFIFSLSSSALVHLGEIPEPETQHVRVDLPMAKQIIDTLGMLQEKTKGNLDPDEDRLMKSVLYDLRMRYVQKDTR